MNTKERLEMIDKILKHSDKDVEKISEKESITPADLCVTKDFAKTMYYKKVLESMEEHEEDDGYSGRGYSRRGGSYGYSEEGSYRRGRDSRTGRYMSRDSGSYRGSYRGYSRDDAKDEMLEKLHEAMESATSEHERHAIMRCMEKLED